MTTTLIWSAMMPAILLLLAACAVLLLGVFKKTSRILAIISMASLALSAVTVWYGHHSSDPALVLFRDQYVVDQLTRVLQTTILLSMLAVVFFSHLSGYDEAHPAEYHALLLTSTLGMLMLSGATHLLLMFVSVELMSLPIVTLVELPGKLRHIEGALKYFITGGVASCLLLFGCSLLYGATGMLGYVDIASIVPTLNNPMLVSYACVFIVAGLAFKLGTAPFHMWVPDVYEGANTPTAMLLATSAKVAAVGMLIRLLMDALAGMIDVWQPLILSVALLSIVLGNLIAVVQRNIRRLLAYSSIAHMGYLLLGVYVGAGLGLKAVTFYLLTYAITSVVAFSSLIVLQGRHGDIEDIQSLTGLNTLYPWQAFTLLLSCFSLAGVPPLIGFMGKLMVFKALVGADHEVLAAIAILFAVVGAYYYIRIIQQMYFEQVEDEGSMVLTSGAIGTGILVITGLSLLGFGLLPNALLNLA